MEVERKRSDLARELEKIDDQLRIRLLTELQEATVKLTAERAKLQSAEQKLQLAGLSLPQPPEGGSKPQITVFRSNGPVRDHHTVDADTELQPGDVITVSLHPDSINVAAQ
jgi:polysaccharide export outer membrane protein